MRDEPKASTDVEGSDASVPAGDSTRDLKSRIAEDILQPQVPSKADRVYTPSNPDLTPNFGIEHPAPGAVRAPVPQGMLFGPDDPFFTESRKLRGRPDEYSRYDPIGPMGGEPDFDEFIPPGAVDPRNIGNKNPFNPRRPDFTNPKTFGTFPKF